MNNSLDFYSLHADDFFERTLNIDVSALYSRFLPQLPAGGSILDAGCGSGRDSRYFLEAGYVVHAIDAVPELAERASQLIGKAVEAVSFTSFRTDDSFDGIWACASLLHTPASELPEVIEHLASCLKHDGIFYMSFKYGRGETIRGKRCFTDMDEAGIENLDQDLPSLRLRALWLTQDQRLKRDGEMWMNAIWKKTGPSRRTGQP